MRSLLPLSTAALLLVVALPLRAGAFSCPNYINGIDPNKCNAIGFCGWFEMMASARWDNMLVRDEPGVEVATRLDPWTDTREVMVGPGDPEGRADATFEAGRGFVVAVAAPRANSSCCDFPPTSGSGTGRTLAVLRVDDLVFSGPGADVETSLHLVYDGSYTEFAENIETATAQSSITVDLGGSLCNGEEYVGFRGNYRRVLVDDDGDADPRLIETRTGVFDGVGSVPPTGQTGFAVGPFTVPTGTPLTLEIWLEALLQAVAAGGNARATGDFSLALGALGSGEVFDLPEGYTADSATAGIEANQVPEPAAGSAGLLATAWLAWRSSRTRASRAPAASDLVV